MAQEAVLAVLERGASIAVDEAKYLLGVSDKLKSAKDQLRSMKDFLTDLDHKMFSGGDMEKSLVSRVRGVAYEVEDVIDTANIMTRQSDPRVSIKGAVSKYACFPIHLTHLHKLGARLDSATAKMKNIFEEFDRHKIVAARIEEEPRSRISADDRIKHWRAGHTDFGDEFDVIGFDDQIEQIKNDLLDRGTRHLTVVSLVGPGGAGKTTMAKKVYGSAVVKGHFEAHAWITVSQNFVPHVLLKEMVEKLVPRHRLETMIEDTIVVEELERVVPHHFLEEVIRLVNEYRKSKEDHSANKELQRINRDDLEARIKCLLNDFKSEDEAKVQDHLKKLIKCIMEDQKDKETKELEKLNEEQLTKLIRIYTLGKRYLILLDDIWSQNAWDIITPALLDKKNGSRVVLTTRNELIAQYPRASKRIYKPNLLNEEESTRLLLRTALPEHILDGSSRTPEAMGGNLDELKKLGKELAIKCRGLPLAIIVLGGYLSSHFDVAEWKRLTSSMDWHALFTADTIIGAILDLSYYDMPSHLRACFMYTTAFPEDSRIDMQVLAMLWVAEGFILPDRIYTRGELADKYMAELVQRCMIQVEKRARSGRIKVVKVHDILRDWAIGRARRQGLLKDCHSANDIDTEYPDEMVKSYRVVLHGSLGRRVGTFTRKLRTLLAFKLWYENGIVSVAKSIESFKGLRVLYLHTTSGYVSLPWEIGRMRYLRYLGLGGSTQYTLPSSIGNLLSLETVDAAKATIDHIPGSLWKVPTLRNVRIFRAIGWSVPRISSPSKVHMTILCSTGDDNKQHLEAKMITEATKRQFSEDKIPSLSYCLGIIYHMNSRMTQMDIMGRCKGEDQFTNDIIDFEEMGKIEVLKICCVNLIRTDQKMLELGWINNLIVLEIGERSYAGSVITCPPGSFHRLERLVLHDLLVDDWKVEFGSMISLRVLTLCKCGNLSYLPEGLSWLPNLSKLNLIAMPPSCCQQGRVTHELKTKGCVIAVSSNEKDFQHLGVPADPNF